MPRVVTGQSLGCTFVTEAGSSPALPHLLGVSQERHSERLVCDWVNMLATGCSWRLQRRIRGSPLHILTTHGSGNHRTCDHRFNGGLNGWTTLPPATRMRTEIVSGLTLWQPYNVQSILVDFGWLYKVNNAFLNYIDNTQMCIGWKNIVTLQKRLRILWPIPNLKYSPSGKVTTATTMANIILVFLFVSEVYLHTFLWKCMILFRDLYPVPPRVLQQLYLT